MSVRKALPKRFPIDKLAAIDFGDSDAFRDRLLFLTYCYSNFMDQARYNKKTILVGPKGCGKSALFRALVENYISPVRYERASTKLIPVSDELKYLETEKIIREKFSIYGYSDEFKYALLWDIYIVFRILIFLRQHYYRNFSDGLKRISHFFDNIKVAEKSNLTIFLRQLKNIRFSASATDGTTVYTSGLHYDPSQSPQEENKFDLQSIKDDISNVLTINNVVLWVVFDRLDDFVQKESVGVQGKLLQGLITAEDFFGKYQNIFVKIFMRPDLFHSLDLSYIGRDKLFDSTIDICWHPTEIRRFLAHRILYNIMTALDLKKINFEVEEKELKFKKEDLTDLRDNDGGNEGWLFKDPRQGRKISIEDYLARKIITMIFPRRVFHLAADTSKKEMDVFTFLETHFNLASAQTTPRIMLQFLDLCLKETQKYYLDNYDEAQRIDLDENGEYPLIKRVCFEAAYAQLVHAFWGQLKEYRKQWHTHVDMFASAKKMKTTFDYKFFKECLNVDDDEVCEFIRFLQNAGAMRCTYKHPSDCRKSKYELPIFLRASSYYKNMYSL